MCRWRQWVSVSQGLGPPNTSSSVRNVYLRCGHAESLVSPPATRFHGNPDVLISSPPSRYARHRRGIRRDDSLTSIKVKCGSTHCKFSPNHPSSCVPPSCSRTCNQ
ncbi:hypothetical protein C8R46DRAFT_882965 [Mycena filopes]|nr:hypothetical protein C8R46DRAFT_882965 [Mycena filopes]